MLAFGLSLALFITLGSGTLFAQSCTPPGGGWSISNQPPVGCRPYPNSLWVKQLPNAGSGGPMNHLAPNSDAIIQNQGSGYSSGGTGGNFLPGAGGVAAGTTGDSAGVPLYYGRASDPIYKVDQCRFHGGQGGALHDPAGTFWHVPNGAYMSDSTHPGADAFLAVWDQTKNMVLQLYGGTLSGNRHLPNCTATTNATACSMGPISFCNQANYTTDPGWNAGDGGDSLHNAPVALSIRGVEWIWPTADNPDYKGIKHALYLNGSCEASLPAVFPGIGGGAAQCNDPAGPKPIHGSLIFMDYTDAQIEAMNIPAWRKPIIWTMSHYGGYFGDTNDSAAPGHGNQGTYFTRSESVEAYRLAGIDWPITFWMSGQGFGPAYSNMTTKFWGDFPGTLPNVVGPNCPSSTCGAIFHTHIADQCVALGLAGQPGGCVVPSPPPSSPLTCLSTSNLSFAARAVGTTSVPQTASITNCGTATLSSIAVSNSNTTDFGLTYTGPSSLAADATSANTISVVSHPSASGVDSGTISVTSNAATKTISLSGSGPGAAPVPNAPTSLNVSSLTASTINLAWTASSTTSPAITNYKIYRGSSSGGETLLATVGNVTSYADTTVSVGNTYFYRVTAVNANGESLASNELSQAVSRTLSQSTLLMSFGVIAPLSSSSPQTVTLTKTGTVNVAVSSVTSGSSEFTVSSNTCGTLSTTCTFNLTFSPTVSGYESATITIADDASGNPHHITAVGGISVGAVISIPGIVRIQ